MDLSEDTCPLCKQKGGVQMLATTNEWKYYCEKCDKRFNAKGEEYNGQKAP